MRILVVEDEPDLLGVLAMTLREAGHDVDTASDGREGLFKATAGDHALVVLDGMLPELDGLGVLRGLRATRQTPVLMLTARDAVPDRVAGLDAGADDYLTKPFEMAELLARVRSLGRRDAQAAGGATTTALAAARQIQQRLMPDGVPASVAGAGAASRVDAAFACEPAQWVGGDYCDLWAAPDGRLAFAVADVSGKGLPAAIVTAALHAALRAGTAFLPDPAGAVAYADRHLSDHLPGGLFASLFLGLLDPATGRLDYVNAGHPMPALVAAAGAGPLGEPANAVLGIDAGPFAASTHAMAAGSTVVAYTDGVSESRSPGGELFGDDRMISVADSLGGSSADDAVRAVVGAAAEWRGVGPPQDDVTVLAVRWLGPGGDAAAGSIRFGGRAG